MSYTALFFNFSKRRNSTKVPVDSTGTSFDVLLKNPTSFEAPTFRINADTFSFNYAKFNGAYYFVEDVTAVRNDLYDVTLSKDVLATYRNQIFATRAYVLYDNVGNSEIVDNRLAIETSRTVQSNSVAFPAVSSDGIYVISVVGQQSTASWRLNYGDTPAVIEFSTIFSEAYDAVSIYDSDDELQIIDVLKNIKKNVTRALSFNLSNGSAIDAVRACVWLPFRPIITGASGQIWLGNYNTAVNATKITEPIVQLPQTVVNIPWQFNDWRRNAPYTQVYLYVPFIGVINLPASQLTGASAITIQASLNVISGDLSINVNNDQQVLGSYGANVAMPVPIGNSNLTQRQLVNTIVSGAAGALSAALGIGAGAAALSGVAMAAASQIGGVPTSVGGLSSGSAAGLSTNIICFTSCHDTNVAPASVAAAIGLPAFAVKQIGTLSGYVQTHEFSLDAQAIAPDLESVNTMMNGGVFIE